jgi:hypothetical protein
MDLAKVERLSELAGLNASEVLKTCGHQGTGNLSQVLNRLATDFIYSAQL